MWIERAYVLETAFLTFIIKESVPCVGKMHQIFCNYTESCITSMIEEGTLLSFAIYSWSIIQNIQYTHQLLRYNVIHSNKLLITVPTDSIDIHLMVLSAETRQSRKLLMDEGGERHIQRSTLYNEITYFTVNETRRLTQHLKGSKQFHGWWPQGLLIMTLR